VALVAAASNSSGGGSFSSNCSRITAEDPIGGGVSGSGKSVTVTHSLGKVRDLSGGSNKSTSGGLARPSGSKNSSSEAGSKSVSGGLSFAGNGTSGNAQGGPSDSKGPGGTRRGPSPESCGPSISEGVRSGFGGGGPASASGQKRKRDSPPPPHDVFPVKGMEMDKISNNFLFSKSLLCVHKKI
jgi:hypothetical protein